MRTSITIAFVAAALGLGAMSCGSTTPFQGAAVEVTVQADPTLAADVTLLTLATRGAETFDLTSPAGDAFRRSGTETVTYRAGVTSGVLEVTVNARDLTGAMIATGQSNANLTNNGTTKVTVQLAAVPKPPPPDMSAVVDMAMAPPPDLAPYQPIVPSHVAPNRFVASAPPISGLVEIDTTALTFRRAPATNYDGGTTETPDAGSVMPPGVQFVVDGNYAVLSVGALTVDKELFVRGSRPLVIVSAGEVLVSDVIHAEALNLVAGPGGSPSNAGAGAGGPSTANNSGSGGAGHGLTGGTGGTSCPSGACGFLQCCGPGGGAGAGGAAYGTTVNELLGGSGGGGANCGGAGGGAIQISAAGPITVSARGAIHAGGGAGNIGCGGGSGGEIFLEGRGVIVQGTLAANGGGGGAGPQFLTTAFAGTNSLLGPSGAPGGVITSVFNGAVIGTTGGIGGARGLSAGNGASNNVFQSGGGGGAVGVIWIRVPASVTPSLPGSISPTASIDTTF